MNLIINGEAIEGEERTLEELCKRFKDHPHFIATAVNGTFVSVQERGQLLLNEGDKIEILSPRQGG